MLKMLEGRGTTAVAVAALLVVAASAPALAKSLKHTVAKPAAEPAKKDALSNKPTLVGTYGDWGAYEAQGAKGKICYALAQPKERLPSSVKKDGAYVFISTRPGEKVKNEVSVIMGIPLKEGSADAKAEIGTTSFDLVTKGQNAWVKDSAQENQIVESMKKHGRLIVKAPSAKGAVTTDSYSLSGLGPALDRVAKDCS